MALVGPVEGRGGASAAKQVDVAVLERHGVGRVAHADDGDEPVFLRDIVWRVINDSDNKVGIAAVHAPEPVVVVSAEGRWKVEMIYATPHKDAGSAAYPKDRLGLVVMVQKEGAGFTVAFVSPDSPAANAGFKVGDKIASTRSALGRFGARSSTLRSAASFHFW